MSLCTIKNWTYNLKLILVCALTSVSGWTVAAEENLQFPVQENKIRTWEVIKTTGQILGVSEKLKDPSTLVFELATGFQVGHVGIAVSVADIETVIRKHPKLDPKRRWAQKIQLYQIDKDRDDNIVVFHSDPEFGVDVNGRRRLGGVGASSLQNFTYKAERFSKDPTTIGYEFEFMHIQPKRELTETQKEVLVYNILLLHRRTALGKLGYNFTQKMQPLNVEDGLPTKLNCSEFIHYVFHKAGMKIGRPQQMKDLNLGLGYGLLKYYFKATGLYNANAWCVTPKSVMQAGVYDEKYNSSPEFECPLDSGRDANITNSEKEIVDEWWEKAEQDSFLKTLRYLASGTEPFEKNCFRQGHDEAITECDKSTRFYNVPSSKDAPASKEAANLEKKTSLLYKASVGLAAVSFAGMALMVCSHNLTKLSSGR